MTHPFLTRGGAELTGGPARVTFPTEPVQPAQAAPLPTPALPTPPLPTPPSVVMGADGDGFQFADDFLGVPNSPEEALELLGFQSSPVSGSGGPSFGGERTIFFFDEGAVTVESFPGVMGGAFGARLREDYHEAVQRCLDGGFELPDCI